MSQSTVEERAAAKINLALHVVGQRADGYHLLEMLVTFADFGDELRLSAADGDSFSVSGRFATDVPQGTADEASNLVLRARDFVRADFGTQGIPCPPVSLHLTKNLPVASGIGGGSADAAATIRGLSRLWGGTLSQAARDGLAMQLGADVPMCLYGRPAFVSGIGEALQPVATLPSFAMVLGNPLTAVSTPAIFKRLQSKTNPPLVLPDAAKLDWLKAVVAMRNDLEPPAREALADIAAISDLLTTSGAALVRMSGSGATCFGIFENREAADAACRQLVALRPDWYFQATSTTGM